MTLFEYLIRSTACFALLYLPYLLLFRRLTFFQWQRFYLLLTGAASVVLPFFVAGGETISVQAYWLKELLAGSETPAGAESVVHTDWFSLVYFSGVFVFAGLFLFRLSRLLRIVFVKAQKSGDLHFLPESYPQTAFSFFRRIVLHPGFSEGEKKYIVKHERTHARQLHTLDLLFYEWLCVFAWFNPLYRLARKQLAETHEFIADEQACGDDAVHYQRVLVAHVLGLPAASLTHSFSRPGSLQSRINMMNKTKSPKAALFGYLLAVPFLTGAMMISSFTLKAQEETGVVKVSKGDQVEKQPGYKGGNEAMVKFLSANIHYPEDAKKAKTAGMVVVNFVVDENGKVTKAQVKKSVSPSLDAEALRVINSMPDWTPGETKEGKKVKAEMNIPIRFALD
ncbi:MAG: TonB family protein [Bacteroidetes bacterium]|nr:MAG: TonB family protein [Bacteroidota bacterium]